MIKKLLIVLSLLVMVALPACLRSDVEPMGTSNYTSTDNAFSGSVAIGDGSPSVTQDGEDLYVEDQFEVDGEAQFDGAIDANSTSDYGDTVTFSKGSGDALSVSAGGALNNDGTLDQNGTSDFGAAVTCSYAGNCLTSGTTADLEWLGFASIGNGTPDGVTDGTAEDLYVEGGLEVDKVIYADGAIDADSTSNFADTATFSKGSGDAVDISSGGALNNDGTLDQNGTSDFGAALNCSYAGDCLTSGATADIGWLGFASFGDGTPDGVTDGTAEDVYIEGGLEVDKVIYADGAIDADSTSNFADTATFSKGSGTALDVSSGGELNVDGTLDVNGASDFSDNVVIAKTTTDDSYDDLITAEWTAGADMTAGGSNGIYAISNPAEDVQNAYALRGRMDLRDATEAVTVNQLHAIDSLINLNTTYTYTVDDNISGVSTAIHGAAAAITSVIPTATLNLYHGIWSSTATSDVDVQTNGLIFITFNNTVMDYGVQVQSSSDMDAGLYLNSHASNSGAKMDVGVEMASGASDMIYGVDMEAASFSGADIVGDNGETLDNGTDTAWVIGGFIAAEEGTVIDLGAGGTITPTASYQPITNSTDGSVTTDTSIAIADGPVAGAILILCNEDAQDIVIKDGANTAIGGDITLTGGALDTLTLIWNGADWVGMSMMDN